MLFVYRERRHLMVWRVFAPKFVFDAAAAIVVDIAVLLVMWMLKRILLTQNEKKGCVDPTKRKLANEISQFLPNRKGKKKVKTCKTRQPTSLTFTNTTTNTPTHQHTTHLI
jgi:hypothetical protein